MKSKLRDGTVVAASGGQDKLLSTLYGSVWGRLLLKPLTCPILSRTAGRLLSTRVSCLLIAPFVRKNHIDMSLFEAETYASYNEFFSRRIRPEKRPVEPDPQRLISPCDSKLTALPVTAEGHFTIKDTPYTLASLLKNEALAAEYAGGQLLIFRLTVDDYHRYCFASDGEKGEAVVIPGILHTVNPIANDYYPIYKENAREYCVVKTKEFGNMLVMEVGALLVGKIVNHAVQPQVRRGQEKGYFRFGGSTVVMVLQPGTAQIDADILANSREGYETVVKYGEAIGTAIQ